ncbi:MAG TPA: TetR/AcrR family transcriptional regulator [Longimicrobiales bacterium]
MGSKERRERERAETRRKILDAARDMFVEHGYEGTTMRAIARRIDYTPTAIYHHFRSKEALLYELCDEDFRALGAAMQRIGTVDDPLERIDRIGAAYVEFALTHPMHYRLLFMTRRPALDEAEPQRAYGDPGQRAYAMLREACADAIARERLRPEYDDPDQVAQMLWATMHGIVSLHVVKKPEAWIDWRDTRDTAARLRAAVRRGLSRDGAG